MARRRIFLALLIILIIISAIAILAFGSNFLFPASICIANEPDLGSLLNKSGSYSFSYVNAHGKRIAAIDESQQLYFYIYGVGNKLEMIIDHNNESIWQSKCT